MSHVGDNIRRYRVGLGLSQAELGERVGKKRSAIGNYEGGTREPDYATLLALAKALGVTASELLGDSEDDVWDAREAFRRDPERRILFSLARHGSAEDVHRAVALIDALKKTNPDFYDGDE